MGNQLKRVQTVFNLSDSDNKKMYEHVSAKPNSSGYIKRLIQRDMDQSQGVATIQVQTDKKPIKRGIDFNLSGFV
jgi:hypothetical protein